MDEVVRAAAFRSELRVTAGSQPLRELAAELTVWNFALPRQTHFKTFCEASTKPLLYSHKGALGHSLGAAGLVAVVLNALAHRHGIVPPNVRTSRPLPARAVHIDRDARRRPIRRSIAIASGFGGASAALSLRSV